MNLRVGRVGRLFTPGYGSCGRCRTPWPFVQEHTTWYHRSETDDATSGCFPLCEKCWTDLKTPARRLLYYRNLWMDWITRAKEGGHPTHEYHAQWPLIEAAVRAGG